MNDLLHRIATSPLSPADMVAHYERDVEDILVILEDSTNQAVRQLNTRAGRSTIGEELKLARESYEDSFTYRLRFGRPANRRFIALEAARERLHSIILSLP